MQLWAWRLKRPENTGKLFRAANGGTIKNEGEALIKATTEGGAFKFKTQVAKVTKPLGSANEMVDAGNWIILHKKGGIVQRLKEETKRTIMEALRKDSNQAVPIERKNNAFTIEMFVEDVCAVEEQDWTIAKKTFSNSNSSNSDSSNRSIVSKTQWEEFWNQEDSTFHRP